MCQFPLLQGSKALDQIKKKNQPKESSAVDVEVKDHVPWLQGLGFRVFGRVLICMGFRLLREHYV